MYYTTADCFSPHRDLLTFHYSLQFFFFIAYRFLPVSRDCCRWTFKQPPLSFLNWQASKLLFSKCVSQKLTYSDWSFCLWPVLSFYTFLWGLEAKPLWDNTGCLVQSSHWEQFPHWVTAGHVVKCHRRKFFIGSSLAWLHSTSFRPGIRNWWK